jgi:hypothetical protein
VLQLTAVDRFCFVHHDAASASNARSCRDNGGVSVDPGIDIATHLNIVASRPPGRQIGSPALIAPLGRAGSHASHAVQWALIIRVSLPLRHGCPREAHQKARAAIACARRGCGA